ncbi:MAG: hypothetical protein JW993_16365 [Sedimentisphaerales bacterium]|nr:hypothetical protein [Sedimentisphaerales bacterium]
MKALCRKIVALFVLALMLVGSTLTLGGCGNDSDMEDTVEEAGDAVEEAGEEVQDAAEDAADQMGNQGG